MIRENIEGEGGVGQTKHRETVDEQEQEILLVTASYQGYTMCYVRKEVKFRK